MTTSSAPSDASPSSPIDSGRAAALAWFFINGATFGTWATRIPDIKQRFDLSEGDLGMVLLAMAAGAVLAFALTSRLSERFGPHRVSGASAVCFIALLPVLAYMPSPLALAIVLLCFGATGGSLDLAMNAYGAEVEARRARSTMSMLHGFWSLGFGVAAGIGWLSLELETGIILHFWAVAAAMLLLALFASLRAVPALPTINDAETATVGPPRLASLLVLAAIALVCFLGEGALLDWIGVHVIQRYDAEPSTGAAFLALFSLVMIVLRLTGDGIITRVGATLALRCCVLSAVVGFGMIALAPSLVLVAPGIVLTAMGLSLMAPLAFSAAGRRRNPARAIAITAIGGYSGILIGPVIMGFVGEALSLAHAFALLGLMALPLLFIRRLEA